MRNRPEPEPELGVVDPSWARGEPLIESDAAHQLHGEVVVPVVGVAGLVDGGDVGVLEAGERLGLAAEHLDVELVDHVVAAHDLERDPSSGLILLGLPDDTHPAAAEPAEDPEPADCGRVAQYGQVAGPRRMVPKVVSSYSPKLELRECLRRPRSTVASCRRSWQRLSNSVPEY